MSLLDQVRDTRANEPLKLIVYGPGKIGKSTFASQAPSPIFIQTEDGLSHIQAKAFPLARTHDDVLDAIKELYESDHQYRTVVIDSMDWYETLLWNYVCQLHGVDNIERVGGGYGKGYLESERVLRNMIGWLEALRHARGMNVIFIAHDHVRTMEPPEGASYTRNEPRLQKRTLAVVVEWADIVGYCHLKTLRITEDEGFNKKRTRAVSGDRTIAFDLNPAYLAGSRYPMPAELPLEWSAFEGALIGENHAA